MNVMKWFWKLFCWFAGHRFSVVYVDHRTVDVNGRRQYHLIEETYGHCLRCGEPGTKAKDRAAKVANDECPECGGELDTGYECNDCGFDARPEVVTYK